MKRFLTRTLLIGGAALLMFSSCKKEETKAIATSGTAGALSASSTTVSLSKANAANNAVTFNVTAPSFGYSAAVTNTLQIDAPGDNWAKPKEVVLSKTAQSYNTVDFNAMLLALGLAPGQTSTVQVRVKSSISPNVAPVYSNVLALSVTPYALVSYVYVPGAYQGWNPAAADSLTSATSNGVFTGVIKFVGSDPNFKITTAKNWANAYGDAGGGKVSFSGGNLTAPASGNVQVVLDENQNTIVMAPYQWSIIGDGAQGWNAGNDVDMAYNNGTQTWSTTTTLTGGKNIKFRLNHDWAVNDGATGSTLVAGGDNIPVAASGTYLVVLDLVNKTYTLTKQ